MSTTAARAPLTRPLGAPPLALMLAAGAFAVLAATQISDPTPANLLTLATVVGLAVAVVAMLVPYAGYLVLVGSTVFMIAVSTSSGKSFNLYDLLLPPVLIGTMWGSARSATRAERRQRETGIAHDAIDTAHRRLTRGTGAYFILAALSLGITVMMGMLGGAMESALSLIRGIEGLLIFPLVIVWVRDLRSLRHTVNAMLISLAVCAIVNVLAIGSGGEVTRASMVWFVNEPNWSMGSPNELGTTVLMTWVLILALQHLQPRAKGWLVLFGLLLLLIATQSRGSLLAWLVLVVLSMGRIGWRVIASGLAILSITVMMSGKLIDRLSHSATFNKGTFEVFSAMIRVFGWKAAFVMFRDHPIFGVGYMGFRHLADRYNQLGLVMAGTENMYLEVATGMGIVGLIVFGAAIVRLYRLGGAVRSAAPPGTLGHELAQLNGPFLTALLSVGLTGTLWVGMLGLAQLSLWCALLIRAGHVAITDRR